MLKSLIFPSGKNAFVNRKRSFFVVQTLIKFFLDVLIKIVKPNSPDASLVPCQKPTMELFRQHVPSWMFSWILNTQQTTARSSPPEVFLGKDVLKRCCKATLLKSHFGMGVLL